MIVNAKETVINRCKMSLSGDSNNNVDIAKSTGLSVSNCTLNKSWPDLIILIRRLIIVGESYFGLFLWYVFGHIRRVFALFIKHKDVFDPRSKDGYVPLYHQEEDFFKKHFFRRVADCFSRPICSKAGTTIDIMDWSSSDYNWTIKMTGNIQKVSVY